MIPLTIAAAFSISLMLSPAEKLNPADYPVVVHVQSSRLIMGQHPGDGDLQDLSATIEGKHYQLESNVSPAELLRTGDYKAKLIKQDEARPYEYQWYYQFLFADGKTRKYQVIGEDQ